MADFVFDAAKAKAAMWAADVNLATGSMEVILLEAAGLEADSVLVKKLTMTNVFSGTTNEQTTMGRRLVSGAGSMYIHDDTVTNHTFVGFVSSGFEYLLANGNLIGAVVIAYRQSGAGSGDSVLRPVVKLDLPMDPGPGTNRVVIDFGTAFLESA